MPRKSNAQLAVPKQVVWLPTARFADLQRDHRVYVGVPCREPAPCLVVYSGSAGEEWEDRMVILPEDGYEGNRIVEDVVFSAAYASALGLVATGHRKQMSCAPEASFFELWRESKLTESPFAQYDLRTLEVSCHGIIDDIDKGLSVAQFRTALLEFQKKMEESLTWAPVTLIRRRPALGQSRNWQLVNAWFRWQKQGRSIDEQYLAYRTALHSPPLKESKQGFRAFKKALHYLCLPTR